MPTTGFSIFATGFAGLKPIDPQHVLLNLEDAMAHLGGLGAGRKLDGGE
jgi:hypothetical protein